MKIGMKITLLVATAVFGLVVVFVMSLLSLNKLDSMFTYIGTTPVKNVQLANQVLNDVNIIARQTALLGFDTSDLTSKLKTCDDAIASYKKLIDTLKNNVFAPEMINLVGETETALKLLEEQTKTFKKMFNAGNLDGAREWRSTTFSTGIANAVAVATETANFATGQTFNYAFVVSVDQVNSTNKSLIILSITVFIALITVAFLIVAGITKPLAKAVSAAEGVAKGNMDVDLETNSKDEIGTLLHTFDDMVQQIKSMIKDTNMLSSAAVAGKLEVRAETEHHQGAYKELIIGINQTLDAVIGPLNVTAEYVDRISKGDIPPKITDVYNGDFNEIKENLNGCIDAVGLLINEINLSINNALDGNFQYKANAKKHQGDYSRIMQGVNQLVEAFVEPLKVVGDFLHNASVGSEDIKKITQEYKGDFNLMKNSMNRLHDVLFTVLGELARVAEEAKKGNLDVRADVTKVQGAWVMMMGGLNSITEASGAIINDAGDVLSTMATGDLTPRINKNYPGKFGEMRDNINHLGDSLTDLISQLTEAIHTTAAASAEISSTADTLAAGTQQTSSQTDEVATAMEEMSRTVTDNAHNATKTAEVAKQSGRVADTGGNVVRQTVAKMREISLVVKSSADNIVKLGESSKKIGEIISVIDDIADQTNLLSLNAAIEAARAGEQGRGFAVVADSVGKLAISTAGATKEIADMIKGIQNDTEEAVKAMEKGTAEVQSGIELADNAGNSIQNILTGINELLQMVNQIAAASEQQSSTSDEISKNVSSISKVVADSAHNIEGVATTANELARMTETLSTLVSQFKVNVSRTPYSVNSNSRFLN